MALYGAILTKPFRLHAAHASFGKLTALHRHVDRIREDVGTVASANGYRFDRASRGALHYRVDVALRSRTELALLRPSGRHRRL